MSLTPKQVVKKAYDAFTSGDVEGMFSTYADNVIYNIKGAPDIPWAGTFVGKNQVLEFFQNMDNYIEFTKFEMVEMIAEGNTICILVDSEIKSKKTDVLVSSNMVHLIRVKAGKITEFTDFADTHLIYKSIHAKEMAG